MSGEWTEVEIDGQSADVFEPAERNAQATGVLFLHGHGEITLRGNSSYTDLLNQHGLVCVCPHGRRSWWMDRICSEFDPARTPSDYLQTAVVPYFQQRWGIEPPAIGLLGTSMGGHGVLHLAFRKPREFPVVVALSPAIDFHQLFGLELPLETMFRDQEEARQASVILDLNPLNWPRHLLFTCDPADQDWFDGASRLAMKLGSSGVLYESDLETSHGGHSWQYFDHMAKPALEFLHERLEQTLRRVE